jgi:hypothetical protein
MPNAVFTPMPEYCPKEIIILNSLTRGVGPFTVMDSLCGIYFFKVEFTFSIDPFFIFLYGKLCAAKFLIMNIIENLVNNTTERR